jgi:hypothetical protein
MKKLILLIVLGLGVGSVSAFAYDSRYENRAAYVSQSAIACPRRRLLSLGLIRTNDGLADKRIGLAFGADFGRRSVTRENRHVVAKGKKFLADSVKQKIDISAR